MRRALDLLFDGAGRLAALMILAIFLLMLYASAGRMAGLRVGGINDIVSWCTAAASFFAMAHAFKHGDFVRVTLVLDHLGPRARRALEIASLFIAAAAVTYLAWWAVRFTYESWQFKDMAGGLVVIPIWIPQLSFVLGSLLFVLAVLDELVIVLRGGKPTYVRMVEERHARGDYSEDL
ncbi:TRAP transporter small permease [Ramlibacter sp. Leaf400]|uniref:TRAP transporter small permease n=1 Tax=Ramlibacter sp. Leaf400 TaxID=1736365 RepID=UPI0007016A8D|nr:TRAP transporter small permease [Ramlibacter sp. Leaf400]KQT13644.1 C4-dicarboxylate ABC transporter permease [Ramlibacter sp. Leaf400]